MRILGLTLTATLALAACGSDTSDTLSLDGSDEASADASGADGGGTNLRVGRDVEIELIDGFTLIPGADVVNNTVVDTAQGKGALVSFHSDKSPEEVAEYYREQAEAAGITIEIETAINDGKMLGGKGEDGTTFSITAYPAGDVTSGQLAVGRDFE